MHGPNVFAVLIARDMKNRAASAFELEHNSRWFSKATGGVAESPTIDSRKTTPADGSPSGDEEESAVNRLILTFDELLSLDNLQNGVQLGTNTTSSHVLLGHRGTKGVSSKQFNITVDETLRIWLHDYSSRHGTAVGHGAQNVTEVRKNETWLLAYEPSTMNIFEEETVHCSSLAFEIQFPNHAGASTGYIENLKAFVKKCQEEAKKSIVEPPGVDGLGLGSEPTTQMPSEIQTLRGRPLYYKQEYIGEGTFGRVHKVIKLRDGNIYAAKTFSRPQNQHKRRRDESEPEWLIRMRREFTLMQDNPHPNLMPVFDFQETPEPAIIMAYYPLGNIAKAGITDEGTYVSSFGQILDGLSYLHAKGIAHRDLKPENFVVEVQPFFKVVITDFGLAKATAGGALLDTFCGSLKYTAPEVFPGHSSGYGPPVDV